MSKELPALGTEFILKLADGEAKAFVAQIDGSLGITIKHDMPDTDEMEEWCISKDQLESDEFCRTGTWGEYFDYVCSCINEGLLDVVKMMNHFPLKAAFQSDGIDEGGPCPIAVKNPSCAFDRSN